MSFNVIVTTDFKKHAKSIGKKDHFLKSDIEALISSLEVGYQTAFKTNPF